MAEKLERLKWLLWHGNVFRALQTVDDLQIDLDHTEHPSPEQLKLLTTVTEFGGYVRANAAWIPNYGERYRSGEAISSAFVESTVNQVVSKRMVKKQQMCWAPKSAHLLLQVRARVLNDELAEVFQLWYPRIRRSRRVGRHGELGRLTSPDSAQSLSLLLGTCNLTGGRCAR